MKVPCVVAAALLVAACSTPPASLGPSAPGSPAAQPSQPPPTATGAALTINVISTEYTTPLLDVTTDGHEIAWSTGLHADEGTAPDLWRYKPGTQRPEPVFANPRRDSILSPIAVDDGRYAFVEANRLAYGQNGYRLWLIPSVGAVPIKVDQGDWQAGEPSPPLPRLTFRSDRLIWSAVHHVGGKLRFELLQFSISTGTTTVLESADAASLEFWNPSLAADGDRFVYATVRPVGGSFEFHVWYRDLASGEPATRLDATGSATNPVLSGSTVLWKHASANVFNRGSLDLGSLPETAGQPVDTRLVVEMGLVTEPSAGERFAAAWRDQDHELRVVELASGSTRVLTLLPAGVPEALVRPDIAGNLIVFVHAYLDAQPLQIAWIDLSDYR